ncbi:hypothetical protein [Nicoliella lavandulae]|uniref:Glycosyl hydrolase family 32 N-terminal domain-containing protein n=1 Tax=Nicoliella lavandulae TaxID=3082954 RepID=A0ABU8SIV5_9LACO
MTATGLLTVANRANAASSAATELVTQQSSNVASSAASASSSASYNANSHAIDTMNSYIAKNQNVIQSTWDQNFHFNASDGFANDIQSILPHYGRNGAIDHWDIYYIAQPLARLQGVQYEWKHMVTKDFKTFSDADPSNRYSLNNVALPDKYYLDSNNQPFQIANNQNEYPWGAAASGSVIDNNGLLTKDQFGNSIDYHAKLAYFTNFSNGQSIHLAYSNNGEQFKPYKSKAVMHPDTISGLKNKVDFRDPYVERLANGKLVAYVAGGLANVMYVFTSSDGVNWDFHPDETIDLTGYNVAEMPVVKTVNGQPMMFFIAGSKDYTGNQSGDYVMTGSFNSDGIFTPTKNSKITKLDNGFDNFAGNYTNLNSKKLISMAWLGNWTYSPNLNSYDNNQHFGTYTLARTIQYQNGDFLVDPIEPDHKQIGEYQLKANHSFMVGTNNKVALDFSNRNQSIKLTRQDKTGNNVRIDVNGSVVTISRSWNFHKSMNKVTTNDYGKNLGQAVLYVDNSSIEVYFPEVHKMYTLMTLSNTQNSPYKMTVTSDATLDYSMFTDNLQTTTTADRRSQMAVAKQQAKQRVLNQQSAVVDRLKNHLTRGNHRQLVKTVDQKARTTRTQLTSANSNLKLATVESNFNDWLNNVKVNAGFIKVNIDKGTRYYAQVGSKQSHKTTKRFKSVTVRKVVERSGQIWQQVQINRQLVYIKA